MLGQVRPFTLVFYLCDQCPSLGPRGLGPETVAQKGLFCFQR